MYFPIGWPRQLRPLNAEEKWLQISSNRERIFLGLLSARHFSIWYCKVSLIKFQLINLNYISKHQYYHLFGHFLNQPSVQIILYTRDSESITEYGENEFFIWRPDSSMVAICVSINKSFHVMFFKQLKRIQFILFFIQTSKGYVLFFKISLDKSKNPCAVYTTFEQRFV